MGKRTVGYLGVAALLLASVSEVLADGITISVIPSNQSASLGATVNTTLEIRGLGDDAAPSLGVFDLNLDFDPSVLSFVNATFGDPILSDQLDPTGLGNTIAFYSGGAGSVELFDLSLDTASDLNNLQAPTFILASLEFDAIGTGASPLFLTINTLGDADGNTLPSAIANGNIDINPSAVPEPLTAGLVPAAMALLAVCIRRRNHLKDSRRGVLDKR